MLYHLLFPLHQHISLFNVTRYITFRTAAASLTAFALSLLLGPWMIRKLREFQVGQVIRQEGPESHRAKAGTPTMGGLLILSASLVPTLLWAVLTNVYVWIAVLATAAFGSVGFMDDYLKIVRRTHTGLIPRYKFGAQVAVAVGVGLVLMLLAHKGLYNTRLIFPFFKDLIPDLGWWYVPFAVLVLVGASNAVNPGISSASAQLLSIRLGVYAAELLLCRFDLRGGARRLAGPSAGTSALPVTWERSRMGCMSTISRSSGLLPGCLTWESGIPG